MRNWSSFVFAFCSRSFACNFFQNIFKPLPTISNANAQNSVPFLNMLQNVKTYFFANIYRTVPGNEFLQCLQVESQGVAASNFAMGMSSCSTRQGLFTSALYNINVYRKAGTGVPSLNTGGFGSYSMNKTGSRQKLSVTIG